MSLNNISESLLVVSLDVKDMRWPTSIGGHGSDAMVIFFPITFSNAFRKKNSFKAYGSRLFMRLCNSQNEWKIGRIWLNIYVWTWH